MPGGEVYTVTKKRKPVELILPLCPSRFDLQTDISMKVCFCHAKRPRQWLPDTLLCVFNSKGLSDRGHQYLRLTLPSPNAPL